MPESAAPPAPAPEQPAAKDPAPRDPVDDPGFEDPPAIPTPQCIELPSKFVFTETFNRPLSGWTWTTSDPPDPDHTWTVVRTSGQGGVVVSDPSGHSREGYENRLDSPAFSLYATTRGYVRFRTRFQHSGKFQVLMKAENGESGVVAEFANRNPSWPEFDCVEAPVPREFVGRSAVQLSLLSIGGESGVGVEVDNLRVAMRTCAEGSVPDGAMTPVLRAHRPLSIQPCPSVEPDAR